MKPLFILFLSFSLIPVIAQNSLLDNTFANQGYLFYGGADNNNYCRFEAVAVQADGKIVAVGYTYSNGNKAIVARFMPDGSIDADFADNGEWISDDPNFATATNFSIQPDGKILVTGGGTHVLRLVRLTTDGQYDPTFGANGKAVVFIAVWPSDSPVNAKSMALQADGKIQILATYGSETHLIRLQPDGTLDGSFGNFGIVHVTQEIQAIFPGSTVNGNLLALAPDGKIMVSCLLEQTDSKAGLVLRYNAAGAPDLEFGENGHTGLVFDLKQPILGMYLLPDGKIWALYDYTDPVTQEPYTSLIRWNEHGSTDASFGVNGVVHFPLIMGASGNISRSGALMADGSLMVFGTAAIDNPKKAAIQHINADGTRDLSFGTEGYFVSPYIHDFRNGVIQPDGKVITLGYYQDASGNNLGFLTRFLAPSLVGAKDLLKEEKEWNVFPNPLVGNFLNINFELNSTQTIHLYLFDGTGKVIRSLHEENAQAGTHDIQLLLPSALPRGVYSLQVQSKERLLTQQVVVE